MCLIFPDFPRYRVSYRIFLLGGGGGGEPMVDVGFSIGGICARVARAKFFKTHPLCHRPRPVLVQSVA